MHSNTKGLVMTHAAKKNNYHVLSLMSRKDDDKRTYLQKQKQTYRHRKQMYGCLSGKDTGRDRLAFGISIYTLLYIKQITIRTHCVAQGTVLIS